MDWILIIILVIGFVIVGRGLDKIYDKLDEMDDKLEDQFGNDDLADDDVV